MTAEDHDGDGPPLPTPKHQGAGVSLIRVALSKKTRFEIFKRDGFRCMYCGAHPPAVLLHVDHIKPVAEGGGNEIDNLITACEPCNQGKGARMLTAVPQSLAVKAAEVAEREEQLRGHQAILQAKRLRLDDDTFRVLDHLYGNASTVPRDNFNSTRRFIEQLGFESVLEAMEIALGSPAPHHNVFRYFCGVCWNRIREGGRVDR